jgi:hypothetical protein
MNLVAAMRYLVALDKHRHFGRAAQACHITQRQRARWSFALSWTARRPPERKGWHQKTKGGLVRALVGRCFPDAQDDLAKDVAGLQAILGFRGLR